MSGHNPDEDDRPRMELLGDTVVRRARFRLSEGEMGIPFEPEIPVTFPTEDESLPVVPTGTDLEPGTRLEARGQEDVSWTLPEYWVAPPESSQLLQCEVLEDAATRPRGRDVYSGRLEVEYGTNDLGGDQPGGNGGDDASRKSVPLSIDAVVLRLTYFDRTGELTTEEIPGTVNPEDSSVTFDLKEAYLKTVYGNVARGLGEEESVEVVFRATFEGWRPLLDLTEPPIVLPRIRIPVDWIDHGGVGDPVPPVHDPINDPPSGGGQGRDGPSGDGDGGSDGDDGPSTDDSEMTRREFTVEQALELSVPCGEHRDEYVLDHDGEELTFGCTPQWSGDGAPGSRFQLLGDLDEPDGVTVYRSMAETNTFLVVPDRYVIAWDRETKAPAVGDIRALHPVEEDRNRFSFQFGVEPDLTPYERQLLEQRLYEYTDRRDGTPLPPKIRFPAEDDTVGRTVAWSEELVGEEDATDLVAVGAGYEFKLVFDSVDRTVMATNQLENERTSLLASLEFDLGGERTSTSAMELDFTETTVGPLDTAFDEEGLSVTNRIGAPVSMRKLLWYTPDEAGYETDTLGPETLEAGETRSFTVLGDSVYDEVVAHYDVQADPGGVLTDEVVELDRVVVGVAVITTIDPEDRSVSRLRLDVEFGPTGTREMAVLHASDGELAGASDHVEFLLPLGEYVGPDEWTVTYEATVSFEEHDDYVSDPIEDYVGGGMILTVGADDIGLS